MTPTVERRLAQITTVGIFALALPFALVILILQVAWRTADQVGEDLYVAGGGK